MSFFGRLFHSTKKESVVLIDISAGSVAGAYLHTKEGELPTTVFTRRLPIEAKASEPHERAMLRALEELGNILIREGAPALARFSGSGRAETILVSVDAPWQTTNVRTEILQRKTPFTFTKAMIKTAIEKTRTTSPEKTLADESTIGTILNGYETHQPYGKKAHRASIILLTSLIDAKVSESIVVMLRGLFHTRNILSIASSSLRYQAMRIAFPHERSALILDAVGPLLSIALMRRGLLVAVTEGIENLPRKETKTLVQKISEELTELSVRYPLPRTIFLIDQGEDAVALEKELNDAKTAIAGLWLSDNPPTIVSVLPEHVNGFVKQASPSIPDLPLFLMALYWKHRSEIRG
jgi:hypothetical protein